MELGAYISLVTFRKDGSEVPTPVWFAESTGTLYVFTEAKSHKVRRLRRDPRIRVAPCTVLGRVTGPWLGGRGRVVEDSETVARAYRALHGKYGWQMRLTDFFSRLSGRIDARAILALDLDPGERETLRKSRA